MKKTILALAISSASIWAAATEPIRITKYTNVHPILLGNAARTEGKVELQLDIDEKGNMKGARVVKGRADLVFAAVQTVRDWHFAPKMENGKPVRSSFNLVLNFDFDNRS
jgi:TonB family protein